MLPHQYKESDISNSKWFYEKVDAVIFHSQYDKERSKELLETALDKIHIVVPHGHFNKIYENIISKKEARKILGLPEDRRIIFCFGSIRQNRGYEYLIEATRNMEDTVVIIAGNAEHKNVYKKLLDYERTISNLRLFIKWIPDKELQLYFNACDIVVLPYTHITTSGVIPTAYAFSRPVVTTNIGGLKDVVNENTGLLVPPGNTEALRNAIEDIFKMDFETMGRYAYEYSKKKFDWELIAHKIKELYTSINK
jgi:glycosyltransferase involved in cell wall biosynthesis